MEVERENQMELNIFSVKFNQNNIKAYNQDSCPAFTGKNIKPAVKTVALGTTTALAYLGVNQTNKKENAFKLMGGSSIRFCFSKTFSFLLAYLYMFINSLAPGRC